MSGLRFLLLEDSLLDTELIHAILTEGGISCDIVQVKTEAEFQTVLEQGNFDLILSDYSLPGFDGIAALEMAHRLRPDVPFIFVTATMGEEVAIETLKSGATDYVLKQRLERIVPSVQRSLREATERRARQQAEAELRQQKEELERANRIKDEFLAVLSHELRSPLNAILGWSKILRSRQLDNTTLMRALETIERNAKLQTQLIEDLLDVSRIIRGKLSLRPQQTNLIPAIEAAIDTMRLAAQAKSIDLQFTIVGNREWEVGSGEVNQKILNSKFFVLGDPSRLQQIVWNLLSNAIKFTPVGGRVEVLLEILEQENRESGIKNEPEIHHYPSPLIPKGNLEFPTPYSLVCAQITVKDTGIGINSDFLPYVFDSFRQADGSTTRKHGGLGLGLAIVRHLVELHGGTVSANSLGDGYGSTFTVRLPIFQGIKEGGVRSQPKHSHSPSTITHSPLFGVRILVVDDEPDSRDFISYALQDCGAITEAVTSASSALKVMESFKPDVIISDIGMPDMDGYSLIRKVRALPKERGGQIPAIALTAYAGDRDRNEAIASGFQKHLSKPIMPDELANVVAELVSG